MDEIDLTGLDIPEKEKRILQAAIGVFSEKGYSAATTSEIAKNAGVAEGTIFRYYKTKKDILRNILIQMINLVSAKVVVSGIEKIIDSSDGKDIRQIFKEILYDRVKLAESVMPMAKVVVTEALYHADVREALYENIFTKALNEVTIFHKKMSARGLIRSDLPPSSVLRSAVGTMMMTIAPKMLFPDRYGNSNFERDADLMIDILLNGLTPREQPNKTE